MDTHGLEIVRSALEPLCGELHDVFGASVTATNAIRADHELLDPIYNSAGADIMRALVHQRITLRHGIGDWCLAGRHNLRGQLMLRSGLMRVLFLHEAGGLIPPPGRNYARRAYYRNAPLEQTMAFDAESSNLIAVWHVDDVELASVGFRIVRPISDRGRWMGAETDVDLDLILPNTSADLARLEFEQIDEDLTLNLPFDDDVLEDEGGDDAETGDAS